MKIMASSPITSWQIDGKIMETVTDFIYLGSKITHKKVTNGFAMSYCQQLGNLHHVQSKPSYVTPWQILGQIASSKSFKIDVQTLAAEYTVIHHRKNK